MDFVLKAVFPRNAVRGLALAREAAASARQRVLGDIVAKDDGTLEWWLSEAPFGGVAYLGSASPPTPPTRSRPA